MRIRVATPGCLKRFRLGQRIVVADRAAPIVGRSGTVVRLLRRDESAWVNMDEDLPDNLRRFGLSDDRANHINLWPDQCTEETHS